MQQVASVLSTQRRVAAESIGRLLIEAGKLRRTDVESVIQLQARRGLRFGEAAVALGLVARCDIDMALARQFSYPIVHGPDERIKPPLVTAYQPHSAYAEVFRNLRSELLLRWFDASTEHKALAIVGVDSNGIIAQVAANLAIVFAQAGRRVLLVDADLRHSHLGALLHCEARLGLASLLAGCEGVIPHVVEPFDYLSLLPAGSPPPNPQELLSGRQFPLWLGQLCRQFEVIIFNTPPLRTCVDAQLIAARTGAALLVAQDDVTRMADLATAQRRLKEAEVAVLGACLLN